MNTPTDSRKDEPAFPRDHAHLGHNGMTLRDYFAAKAMQGMNANPEYYDSAWDWIAAASYEQADAMLAARPQP